MITNLRLSVDRCLKQPLSDEEWDLIEDLGLIRRLRLGEMEATGVAVQVERIRATGPERGARQVELPPMRGNPARDARSELISAA